MKKIFIINGHATAGKDTFVDFVKEFSPSTLPLSTIDRVKFLAGYFGWDGNKDSKGRKFLSDLKDSWTLYNDGPASVIVDTVKDADYNNFFIHCREPQVIDKLVYYFNKESYEVITVSVKRDAAAASKTSNHADADVENYQYDIYIDNNGSLEDLKNKAFTFVETYC